jgi:nitroimidazol reductase NimA-like FMN-containing flavoprotein (pyridoxamine 5'-phosphate oxidase superfamily)
VSIRPSDRIRVRRNPKKGRYDSETIAAVLDRALVAHIAFVAEGEPVCIPTLCARVDDRVYIHGSRASRTLRQLAQGARACLTVTHMHGLVLARSVFEHTVNYESVVAFGRFHEVEGTEERLEALRTFTEKLLPGRWNEVRAPTRRELKATSILAMQIEEASAKVRSGPPDDDDDDTPDSLHDIWAGVIPITASYAAPVASPGLRPEIHLPRSVQQLLDRSAPALGTRDDMGSADSDKSA